MKRSTLISMAIVMSVLGLPANSYANSSTSVAKPLPPRAENIVVSPSTVMPGASVSVTFNVIFSSDNVRKSAVVGFREKGDPQGVYYSSITMDSTAGTPSNQLLNALIQIPAWAPTGKYELQISLPYDVNSQSGFVQVKDALFVGTEAEKINSEAKPKLISQQIMFSPQVKSSYNLTLRNLPMQISSTSNLPVLAYNNTNDVCEYQSESIRLKLLGRCVIVFSQQGNDEFAPAENLILRFSVVGTQKMTITCTKNKITKKISGTNPLCPKGYRKAG